MDKASESMTSFDKYEAAGNDFIVVDRRDTTRDAIEAMLEGYQTHARRWCDRHFGIGADGILVMTLAPLEASDCDVAMHIINADGSIAAMCGNGIRCAGRWFYEHAGVLAALPEKPIKIYTLGGIQTVRCLSKDDDAWHLEVAMACAALTDTCQIAQGDRIWNGQCVNVGNPHAVFEISSSPEEALRQSGAFLSHHSTFPDRCNIEFIRELSPCVLEMAVYERGVGPTLACGTGCVASATAYAHSHGIAEGAIVLHLPGGILRVVIPPNGTPLLQGPTRHVFSGIIP